MISSFITARARVVTAIAALGLLCATASVSPARADDLPPPLYTAVDANGVDLISGSATFAQALNSIGGEGAAGLSAGQMLRAGSPISSMNSYIQLSSDETNVYTTLVLMGSTMMFRGQPAGGGVTPLDDAQGSFSHTASEITYTAVDGTVATFKYINWTSNNPSPIGRIKTLKYPTGEILTFTRTGEGTSLIGLKIESSLGYALLGGNFDNSFDPVAANLVNGACVDQCSGPTYASQTAQGRTLQVGGSQVPGTITLVVRNATGDRPRTYTIQSVANGDRVVSYSDGVGTWTYSYSFVADNFDRLPYDGILTTTVTDPNGKKRIVKSRQNNGHIISDTDSEGRTTSVQYAADASGLGRGKINQITNPEGDRTFYEFDGYRNVTAKWRVPKGAPTGVAPDTIPGATVARASYSCRLTASGANNCKSPDWIRDERGAQTDYTYDPVHGGVLTVTKPAGPNGVRPQTRYAYGQFTARYVRDGALQAAVAPVWRVTQTSACMTLAACAGTVDEVLTTHAYEASNVANNVRLLSTTTRAGNAAAADWATTSFTYNDRGDVVSVDGPLPGSGDVVQTYYDASRWKIGEVGPDPDGTGALLHRGSKTDYRADGQVSTSYVGVFADRAPATFLNGFQTLTRTARVHDAEARVIRETVYGTDATAVAQQAYGFDNLGRQICTTVRMNPASFGAPPASACDLAATGTDGPDRITFTTYDTIGRPLTVTSGYKSGSPRLEKTATYTLNGQEQTVADGKGNLTTYEYDGLDRLAKVRYPNAACCASSTTDYEQYGYDAANNRTSWRRRDGTSVTFTYDALNRANNGLRGEVYAYDNLGRRTSAIYGDQAIIAAYDALSRQTSEAGAYGTFGFRYDLAGNRTRITWPDGFYVAYGYDNVGQMTGISENGVTALVSYGYDDLGRRTFANRPNQATTYGYDATSRLASLAHNLTGTAQDQTWTFAYTAASQVKTRTASNGLYEWSGNQAAKSYTVNGLNQYATAAGVNLGYDARGNLSNDGSRTYGYDLLNNLTSTSAGVALRYDPLGRLMEVRTSSTAATWFRYAGSDLLAEYDSTTAGNGTLLRRYVPGPGTDEPTVWYEGATNGNRRWLLADPQGSIVAVTNDAGVALDTFSYDEYGVPKSGLLPRFQYTGQIWLNEVGLYHYKARAYSPTLGRFLQTDPIGYGDGLNWYAYVGNDPLNRSDPTGEMSWDDVKGKVKQASASFTSIMTKIASAPGNAIGGEATRFGNSLTNVVTGKGTGDDYVNTVNGAVSLGLLAASDGLSSATMVDEVVVTAAPKAESAVASQGPRFARGSLREQVLAKGRQADGSVTCAYCGGPTATTSDHIVPYSKGGATNLPNLDPACVPCNTSKGAKDLWTEWIPPKYRK